MSDQIKTKQVPKTGKLWNLFFTEETHLFHSQWMTNVIKLHHQYRYRHLHSDRQSPQGYLPDIVL